MTTPPHLRVDIHHVQALHFSLVQNPTKSLVIRQANLGIARLLEPAIFTNALMWLALGFREKGDTNEARRLLNEAIEEANHIKYERAIASILRYIAVLDIEQGAIQRANEQLAVAFVKARLHQDRYLVAEIQRLFARLHDLRGDLPAARMALAEAIDLFERLGMRRELAEARQALSNLGARGIPA